MTPNLQLGVPGGQQNPAECQAAWAGFSLPLGALCSQNTAVARH